MSWSDGRPAPDAGWYADPAGSRGLRYWDGATWTGHVTDAPPAAAVAATAAPPPMAPAPLPRTSVPTWIWALLGLIVVLGIGGVGAAVAVPVFHIAQETVWDQEARLNVQDAHAAAARVRQSTGSFSAVTPDELERTEPRLAYSTGASLGPDDVSVRAAETAVTVAVRSRSGTCWVIDDDVTIAGAAGIRTGRVHKDRPCAAATAGEFLVPEEFSD